MSETPVEGSPVEPVAQAEPSHGLPASEPVVDPLPSLDAYRPFPLASSLQAVIDVGTVEVFRRIEGWEALMALLQAEFPSKKIDSVLYSTRAKPRDFSYQLKPSLLADLKRLWALQKIVARNHEVREQERVEREAQLAREAEEKARRR
eukprot:RCo012697